MSLKVNPQQVTEPMSSMPIMEEREARHGLKRRMRRWLHHRLVRLMMLGYVVALAVARKLGQRPREPQNGQGYDILLTGRFESENWVAAHLRPLAGSRYCARLFVVSTYQVPAITKVTTLFPPRWLIRLAGATSARLLVFGYMAIRRRPHIVGGFHIKVNALLAAILAPLIGARSIYFCVGGPTEVVDGGIGGEGTLFEGMETPDRLVEQRLLRGVAACDVVITMGRGAAEFYRQRGVNGNIQTMPGSIDGNEFCPAEGHPRIDLMLVGRLVEIKRIDLFLQAVACISQKVPTVKAAIVGDGPLGVSLQRVADDLGISHCVEFWGFRKDVGECLRQARIFVLTSRSEGLALSLMEAMTCGLPAVVANVGDLGDLVEDGVNGYLVTERSAEAFASRIVDLLTDSVKCTAFSVAARRSAQRYETAAAVKQWDELLGSLDGHTAEASGQGRATGKVENV